MLLLLAPASDRLLIAPKRQRQDLAILAHAHEPLDRDEPFDLLELRPQADGDVEILLHAIRLGFDFEDNRIHRSVSFLIHRSRRIGIAGGSPSSGRDPPILKSIGIGSPGRPAILPGPGEHLEVGTFTERFDTAVGLVWFPAMFTPRRNDQLRDAGAATAGVPAGRKKTQLGVGARPEAEAGKETLLIMRRV